MSAFALEFKKRRECSEVSLIACSRHSLSCTPKTLTQQSELISWSHHRTEGSQKSAAVCSPAPEISQKKLSFLGNILKHQFIWETAQKKSDGERRLQDVHHIHHQKKHERDTFQAIKSSRTIILWLIIMSNSIFHVNSSHHL